MDSNHRPLPCQGSALTGLSYGPTVIIDINTPRAFPGRADGVSSCKTALLTATIVSCQEILGRVIIL
jgi:hypothetical protein